MDKNISKKRKIKNDIVLAVVIVLLATAGLLLSEALKVTGDYVSIKIDGVERYRYSLDEDVDTIIYTGENNKDMNHLVIKNGEVYISEANCPDKICEKQGSVSKVNESIVCLPHKVMVEICSDEKDANVPDVIV